MSDTLNHFLDALRRSGWSVTPRTVPTAFDPDVAAGQTVLPAEYLEFLDSVRTCSNGDSTAWFLSKEDFAGCGDSTFRWNEFELQSIDAADGDREWQDEIRGFWETHLPILLSVKDGYSYLAIDLSPACFGAVVFGREPEFESIERVAPSFMRFCQTVAEGGPASHLLGNSRLVL